MDIMLKFYSDGFQLKPEAHLIRESDRYLWFTYFLWFEFEIVVYKK